MIHSKSIERKSARDLTARIISDLLNPLILPLLVFGMAGLAMGSSTESILKILGITALLFLLIPLTAAAFIMKLKAGSTLDFHDRKVRMVLYLVSILSIGAGGMVFFKESYHGVYSILLITYLVNLILAFLLNLKWKVSVHVGSAVTASVMLSWIGSIATVVFWPAFLAIMVISLIPLLVWARLHLGVHSWFEINMGAFTGLVSTLIMLLLFT